MTQGHVSSLADVVVVSDLQFPAVGMVTITQLLAGSMDPCLVFVDGRVVAANGQATELFAHLGPVLNTRREDLLDAGPLELRATVRGRPHQQVDLSAIEVDSGQTVLFVRCRLTEHRARVYELATPAALIDLRGVFIDVNEAFAHTLGVTVDELRGTSFLPRLHPEDVQRTLEVAASGVHEPTHLAAFENRYRHADGSYRWLEWHLRSDPREGLTYCVALDITDRKRVALELERSAEMLRDAERIAHIGGWALDVETNTLSWSRETYLIHEIEPGTPLDVARAIDFYAPESRPLVSRVVEQGVREGTPWDLVLSLITAKGRRLTVRAIGKAEWRLGKVVRLAGTFQDITQQERHRAELASAHAAALEASNVKSRFLATMSHEMRTPLNGILGLTNLLADTPLTPAQRNLVEDTQACGENLLHLVNDLLDIAKIEANKLELEFVPFAPHVLIREQLRPLQATARPRGVTLDLDIDDGGGQLVLGDPTRFGQIVLNLVSNAVKFTLQGAVHVSLKRSPTGLELTVRDTGVGIPPDRIAGLFSPFMQADSSTTRRFGGTGLGLAICKQLVERMKGSIQVESALGQGTTFFVTLPLASVQGGPRAVPSPGPAPGQRPLSVLIAEDNEINARVAMRFLERLGHRAERVPHGVAALRVLERTHFDLVLMDVNMPEMDGLEATRRLREREVKLGLPRTPVVALTANAMKSDGELCAHAGMDWHLTKPLREDELADALTRFATKVEPEPARGMG